jgi:hypothetical protein
LGAQGGSDYNLRLRADHWRWHGLGGLDRSNWWRRGRRWPRRNGDSCCASIAAAGTPAFVGANQVVRRQNPRLAGTRHILFDVHNLLDQRAGRSRTQVAVLFEQAHGEGGHILRHLQFRMQLTDGRRRFLHVGQQHFHGGIGLEG